MNTKKSIERWWFSIPIFIVGMLMTLLISFINNFLGADKKSTSLSLLYGAISMNAQFIAYAISTIVLLRILSKNRVKISSFLNSQLIGFKDWSIIIVGSVVLLGGVQFWEYLQPELKESAATVLKSLSLGTDLLHNILIILSVTVVAPVGEEILFRGGIFRSIRNGLPKSWGSILPFLLATSVSSFLFADSHGGEGQEAQFYLLLFFGIVTAAAYALSESILTPILIHSINNCVTMFIALLSLEKSNFPVIYLQILVVISPFLAYLLVIFI